MLWILGLIAVAIVVLAGVFVLQHRRKTLSKGVRAQLLREWRHMEQLQDPVRRLLEAEKVFEHLLAVWGFTGTFADKLRSAGARFGNVQSLWDAHKLRNRIAHEAGFLPSDVQCRQAVSAYAQALRTIVS